MTEVMMLDSREVDAHIRAAIRRSGMKPGEYMRRVKRYAEATRLILGGMSVAMLGDSKGGGLTQGEFYGGLWMLLIADLFRDHKAGEGGMMVSFLDLSAEEFEDLARIFNIVGERYYGIPFDDPPENAAAAEELRDLRVEIPPRSKRGRARKKKAPSSAPRGVNTFTAVFQESKEGGYIAFVEELPGANTQGKTLDEVRENLREAVELILNANRRRTLKGLETARLIREPMVISSSK
jgi:predicted RNase H-like HicB family nuclease